MSPFELMPTFELLFEMDVSEEVTLKNIFITSMLFLEFSLPISNLLPFGDRFATPSLNPWG